MEYKNRKQIEMCLETIETQIKAIRKILAPPPVEKITQRECPKCKSVVGPKKQLIWGDSFACDICGTELIFTNFNTFEDYSEEGL